MNRIMIKISCLLAGFVIMSCGCSEVNPSYVSPEKTETDEIDRTAFALGADISWATQMENEGIKFYDADGTETECTALMKGIGMNAVRYRVWVNPEEGWNGKGDVVAKALRAQALGMRIMIDFHYSDTWADPAHQTVPAAWASYTADELEKAVTDHTSDVLSELKKYGVEVEWVQVGNETRDGMLWELGRCTTYPQNYAGLVNAGYDAVKSIYPDAKVIIHLDGGDSYYYYNRLFSALKTYGGKYDIIGMSLYPGEDWQAAAKSCIENITRCYNAFGVRVMICETGMPWDNASNAKSMLSYLLTNAKATGYCDGVFYWEPEAPAGYNGGYALGAFADGKPTEALDAFTEAAE